MGQSSSCQGQKRGHHDESDSETVDPHAASSDSEESTYGSESGDDHADHGDHPSFLSKLSLCFHKGVGVDFISAEALKAARRGGLHVTAKALTVNNRGKQLEDYFEIDRKRQLGAGGYATVLPGRDRKTGAMRAIKCIMKSRVPSTARLRQEINTMLALDHPNIIKLYQTFEDRRCIYLVMEMCAGGELFDRIIEDGHVAESDTAIIMQQIFRAVHHMHEMKICHRDLKPENFLFQSKAPVRGNILKVIDLGIAATFKDGTEFHTRTGTPYYVAPEVLARWASYGPECDLWSCGVVMYVLLSGSLPFKGYDEAATLAKVAVGKVSFPAQAFDGVSEDAKDLIRKLLKKRPQERYTATEALNHPWTASRVPSTTRFLMKPNVLASLRNYRNENKLKKAALHIVARQLDEGQIEQLRGIFTEMDSNNDGLLTRAELSQGLKQAGILEMPEDLRAVMEGVDADGSGFVDYTEFLAATLDRRQYLQESACWAAFRVFDKNDDGRISMKELKSVLTSGDVVTSMDEDSIADLMKEIDQNGDGYIDFQEFMDMMRK